MKITDVFKRIPTQPQLVEQRNITIPECSKKITKPSLQEKLAQNQNGGIICADTNVASESYPLDEITCQSPDLATNTFTSKNS